MSAAVGLSYSGSRLESTPFDTPEGTMGETTTFNRELSRRSFLAIGAAAACAVAGCGLATNAPRVAGASEEGE